MSQLVGANPEELDQLAVGMTTAASRFASIRSSVGSAVQHAPWAGRDADRFRIDWSSNHGVQLAAAIEFLRSAGEQLRRNADEQRRTSADPGSGPLRSAGPLVCTVTLDDTSRHVRDGMQSRLDELNEKRRNSPSGRLGDAEERERVRLEQLLSGNREFLAYSSQSGDHRITEVHGDLAAADKVIIHIPGMSTNLDSYRASDGHKDAAALYNEASKGRGNVAVISFADYDIPGNFATAAQTHGAEIGATELLALVADLHAQGYDTSDISVVAHSYGTVVAGHAMQDGLDVGRVIALGSPGMGAENRAGLKSDGVELFVGAAWNDPIDDRALGTGSRVAAWIPGSNRVLLAGTGAVASAHGASPTSFDGVGRIDVGGANGHSNYFEESSLQSIVSTALSGRNASNGGW